MSTTTISAEDQEAMRHLAVRRLQYRLQNGHTPRPFLGEGRHYIGYVDGLAESFGYVGRHRAEELAVSA